MSCIEDFVKLISDDDPDSREISALRDRLLPRSLFQYRSVSAAKLESLRVDEVWLGCPLYLNDPYDVHIFIDPERVKRELTVAIFPDLVGEDNLELIYDRLKIGVNPSDILMEIITERCEHDNSSGSASEVYAGLEIFLQKQVDGISAAYHQIRSCIGVSSFSERYDSPLMWAHYSDSHKGYCVEYDFSGSTALSCLFPVVYQDDVFECSCVFDKKKKSQAILSALVKSKDWSYEREWRMVTSRENPIDRGVPMRVPIPKKVYLGSLMTEVDKQKVIKICNKKGIDVLQMEHSRNAFKMESREIFS